MRLWISNFEYLFNYSKFQPTVGYQKVVCKVINHTYKTAEFTFARIQQNALADLTSLGHITRPHYDCTKECRIPIETYADFKINMKLRMSVG